MEPPTRGTTADPVTTPLRGRKRRTVRAGQLVRLAIGLAIVVWLFSRMNLGTLRDTLLTGVANWPWISLGVGVLFVGLLTCAARWKLLLDAQGIELPTRMVFRFFFVGHFFNLFMIGATGGDLVKAFLTAKSAGGRKTEAVSTVLIDRAIGLTALSMLSCAMVMARGKMFFENETLRPTGIFILGFGILTALVIALLFNRHWLEHPLLEDRGLLPSPAKRIELVLRRVYAAFFVCRRDHALLSKTFALSMANHLLGVAACVAFGRGLTLPLTLLDYLTYIPIIGVFGAIPITPGGLGIREGIAVILLATAGVSQPEAVLLSLLLYTGLMVWSLYGGLLLVLYRTPADPSLAEKAETLAHQEFETADAP